MTDTAALKANLKAFLHFVITKGSGEVLFGAEYDVVEGCWAAALQCDGCRHLFPPGVGRQLIRETREDIDRSTKAMNDALKEQLGIDKHEQLLVQLEKCCKLAMERQRDNARPSSFLTLAEAAGNA
jgi:hypothetical protein